MLGCLDDASFIIKGGLYRLCCIDKMIDGVD